MKTLRWTFAALGIAAVVFQRPAAAAGELSFIPLLDARWRQEILNTLSASPALDDSYSYGNWRTRFGGEAKYQVWTLRALAQAAGSYDVPNNASFGAGSSYYTLSGNDTSPSQVALAELFVSVRPNAATLLQAGRHAIKDGAEPPSGEVRLDWVQDNRVAERLIGPWEWTNVARRFDGVSGGYNTEKLSLAVFGAQILQGGLAYDNAFKPLDDVHTAGLSVSARPGVLLPKTELRFFDIGYRDDRPITESSLGNRLLLNTIGADLVGLYPAGPGAVDALLWGAYQHGDYGTKTQSAYAFLAELGFGLPQAAWAPWLRGGVNYASGGTQSNANTHTTFFNMAPTNHKFYGIQDLNAFQNLTDIFFQFMVQPTKTLKIDLQNHIFRLSSTRDAWYAGSGPAARGVFGFTARPGAGALDASIGNEIDLVATWTPHKRVNLQAGYSHFEGGAAAESIYAVKSEADFFYFQTALKY